MQMSGHWRDGMRIGTSFRDENIRPLPCRQWNERRRVEKVGRSGLEYETLWFFIASLLAIIVFIILIVHILPPILIFVIILTKDFFRS